jgi:hypothetical protein
LSANASNVAASDGRVFYIDAGGFVVSVAVNPAR